MHQIEFVHFDINSKMIHIASNLALQNFVKRKTITLFRQPYQFVNYLVSLRILSRRFFTDNTILHNIIEQPDNSNNFPLIKYFLNSNSFRF
ncbi:hypothetical protein KS03_2634 [Burkholderia glumae LMG 2196 = ATCC 33617]|nr:hypothetical protein KS03_2634 [Burkholderia glumae LMG 2196 = ATCC 33617]